MNQRQALITEAAQVFAEERAFAGIRAARAAFMPSGPAYERLRKYHGEKTDWVLSAWIDTWLSPAFAHFTLAPHIRALRCPTLALSMNATSTSSGPKPIRSKLAR